MTEDDDLETRIRRDLSVIADAVPDSPVVLPIGVDNLDARRGRLLVAVAAAVLVAGFGGLGLLWAFTDSDSEAEVHVANAASTVSPPSTSAATGTPPPPPAVSDERRIWMSVSVIAISGTDVVFAVVRPPSAELHGVGTFLDRWTGTEWEPSTFFGSCVWHWYCWGELVESGEIAIPDMGVFVSPDGVGEGEFVRLEGLEEGWYRLRKELEDGNAIAVFEATRDVSRTATAVPAPDIENEERLRLGQVVVSSYGGVLGVSAVGADQQAPQTLGRSGHVDRWDGVDWVFVLAVDFAEFDGINVLLPALPVGAYRMSREWNGENRYGQFWAADDIPGSAPCRFLPTLESLIGPDAAAFDGPTMPADMELPVWPPGGFRVQWQSPNATIVYSNPIGFAAGDQTRERVVSDGVLQYWYRSDGRTGAFSSVDVGISLPDCDGIDGVSFSVTADSEEAAFSLAKRLAEALLQQKNPSS